MLENIPFKRPLVLGTGGGNDIVSATLVLDDLRRQGVYADLAGMCSPGAFHVYNGKLEDSVNIVSEDTHRFIESKDPKEISFVDSKLPSILQARGFSLNVYNLSGRYGTSRLISQLNSLIAQNNYDGVVAVDVGGDILARGNKDLTILSPLMDFTALYAISQLNIPSVLVEFGLQTDGELRPEGCKEILEEIKSGGVLLDETKMYKENSAVRTFREIYDLVKSVRYGHTANMTLRTLDEFEDIHTEYRFGVRVLDKKVSHEFPLTLESKYFGRVFTMDLPKLLEARPHAFSYRNNLEMYLRTKLIADTKTEMDTLYYSDNRNLFWLGLVCPQITGNERTELLNEGLDNLSVHADSALVWKKDAGHVRIKKYSDDIGEFVITGDSNEVVSRSKQIVQGAIEND
ncbi:Uncharacterised protein [uncultured archaeon]|nr:Uncharacterised protein [uncultured archaeon]